MQTALSVIGLIAAIAILIWLVVKGFDPIYLTIPIVGLLCLTSWLNFQDQWLNVMMQGAGSMFAGVGPTLLCAIMFGGIYSASGAAKSVAVTLLNAAEKIFKPKPGKEAKLGIWVTVIIITIISGLFAFFGLDGMAVQVVILPIALQMLRRYNLNRVVLPALLYTNACLNSLPFAVNNSMVLFSGGLGLSSTGEAALPGFIGCLVGTAFVVLFLVRYIGRTTEKRGGFVSSKADREVPDEVKAPNFILAVIPMVLMFVLYTFFGIPMPLALVISTLVSFVFFWPQFCKVAKLQEKNVFMFIGDTLNASAKTGVYIVSMVVLLVGYAFVIQQTPAFNAIISGLTSISGSGLMWACTLCMMIAIGISSNPMAGMLTNLNVVAPHFLNAGLPARVVFRIGMTTNAIFDTLPTNVGILVAHDISDVKLRDGYFACFMVSCVAPALMTLTNLVLLQFGL